MTYGEGVMGVSDNTLMAQRRSVSMAGGTGGSTCGQNLDLALIMIDGSKFGLADPAFDAHELPIVAWAQAVWFKWLCARELSQVRRNDQKDGIR